MSVCPRSIPVWYGSNTGGEGRWTVRAWVGWASNRKSTVRNIIIIIIYIL